MATTMDALTLAAAGAAAFAIVSGVFAIALLRLARAHRELRGRLRGLLADGIDASLEEALDRNFDRLERLERRVDAVNELQRQNDELLGRAVQRVGVVRFNPFPESGSDQSFALALLDALGNGVVLSGLYARNETRLFVKPVVRLSSNYALSNEESEAIKRAMAQ